MRTRGCIVGNVIYEVMVMLLNKSVNRYVWRLDGSRRKSWDGKNLKIDMGIVDALLVRTMQ